MAEEGDLNSLRKKRKTWRGKVTKAIKNAMNFSSDSLAGIKQKELRSKLDIVKKLVDEHEGIQEAIIELMEAEGKLQVEVEGETK